MMARGDKSGHGPPPGGRRRNRPKSGKCRRNPKKKAR